DRGQKEDRCQEVRREECRDGEEARWKGTRAAWCRVAWPPVMVRATTSAGLLLYRHAPDGLKVLLAHPGGPYWRNRDAGAWTIPKGEVAEGEPADATARREFGEEIGPAPPGELRSLGRIRQK